jgi:hypothetical protein
MISQLFKLNKLKQINYYLQLLLLPMLLKPNLPTDKVSTTPLMLDSLLLKLMLIKLLPLLPRLTLIEKMLPTGSSKPIKP